MKVKGHRGQMSNCAIVTKFSLKFEILNILDLCNMKFCEIQNFESHWKFDSKLRFFPPQTSETWNLGNGRNLNCTENLTQMTLRLFTTTDLGNTKFWKKVEIWVALKTWLKLRFFDNCIPAKHDLAKYKNWVALKIWLRFESFNHRWPVELEFVQKKKFE